MKRIVNIVFVVVIVAAFFSCKENSFEKLRRNELNKLNEFMRANYSGKDPRPSGLYYFILQEGTGDSIKIGDRVQFFYEIWTLDSMKVLSSGRFEPEDMVVSPPTQLSSSPRSVTGLRSLNEALTYMKKGSRSLLIFDSALGFGQNGTTNVNGFTPLMMEVEVHKVFPAATGDQE